MRNLLIIVFCGWFSIDSSAQCVTPLSNVEFQQQYNLIANNRDEIKKLGQAKRVCMRYCFTSHQVEEIATLFANDLNRLEFCTDAYFKTVDPENYYEVYDAFAYFSNVFRLHDFVMSQRNPGSIAPPPIDINIEQMPIVVDPVVTPPPLPPVEVCEVTPKQFNDIKGQVESQSFNNTKITIAKQAIRSNQCFKAQQIKELLSVFSFEGSKVEIAKYAYPYCIDPQNYFMLNDAFSFSSSVDELNKFLESRQ